MLLTSKKNNLKFLFFYGEEKIGLRHWFVVLSCFAQQQHMTLTDYTNNGVELPFRCSTGICLYNHGTLS